MKAKRQFSKAWLVKVANAIADRLKQRHIGTSVLVIKTTAPDDMGGPGGWYVTIGRIPKTPLRLEVSLTPFAGHDRLQLWAGFFSTEHQPLAGMSRVSSEKLWPVRVVTHKDWAVDDCVLRKPLAPSEFNAPVLESYGGGRIYFGINSATKGTTQQIVDDFCACAVAFFEDVISTLSSTPRLEEHTEIAPQKENQQRLVAHLKRERSRLLSTACKVRDNYACRVCGMRFEDLYGPLGKEFAESHHIVPLHTLRGSVKTRLEDLRTVCANCHRMLHRMGGKRDDIEALKSIYRRNGRTAS